MNPHIIGSLILASPAIGVLLFVIIYVLVAKYQADRDARKLKILSVQRRLLGRETYRSED